MAINTTEQMLSFIFQFL